MRIMYHSRTGSGSIFLPKYKMNTQKGSGIEASTTDFDVINDGEGVPKTKKEIEENKPLMNNLMRKMSKLNVKKEKIRFE